jgi:hypothetical protein
MIQIDFGGKTVNVCEHMSELKGLDSGLKYIIGRFYNKKQLLNNYIGKYTFTDAEDKTTNEENFMEVTGKCGVVCGGETVVNSRIGDYYILFYKLEELGKDYKYDDEADEFVVGDEDEVDQDKIEEVFDKIEWSGSGTFLKADDGQIYFVEWNVD